MRFKPSTLLALSLLPTLALAAPVIDQPYARATAPGAKVGAAFMSVRNPDAQDDELVSASSDVSAATELHVMRSDNGRMVMQPVSSFKLPAQGQLQLAPGGSHVMFIGLKRPLVAGEQLKLRLQFKRAGNVEVTLPVKAMSEHSGH